MRVIAGSARRIQLKTVEGMDTRPTTDRIKETLFNMLQQEIAGSRFLDLFSGSGAVGIEALSRGAKEAVFVEKNPKAAACIRENLKATHLEEKATVMVCDVMAALGRLNRTARPFDYIFMDPPYRCGLERQAAEYLISSKLAGEGTVVIMEASKDTDFDWIAASGWKLMKIKQYKTNQHVFMIKESKGCQ